MPVSVAPAAPIPVAGPVSAATPTGVPGTLATCSSATSTKRAPLVPVCVPWGERATSRRKRAPGRLPPNTPRSSPRLAAPNVPLVSDVHGPAAVGRREHLEAAERGGRVVAAARGRVDLDAPDVDRGAQRDGDRLAARGAVRAPDRGRVVVDQAAGAAAAARVVRAREARHGGGVDRRGPVAGERERHGDGAVLGHRHAQLAVVGVAGLARADHRERPRVVRADAGDGVRAAAVGLRDGEGPEARVEARHADRRAGDRGAVLVAHRARDRAARAERGRIGEVGDGRAVAAVERGGEVAHAALGEHGPHQRVVVRRVARGEDRVAQVQERRLWRRQPEPVGDVLAGLAHAERGAVPRDQRLPERPQRLRPDLAVGVHLGARGDLAEVGVGEAARPAQGRIGRPPVAGSPPTPCRARSRAAGCAGRPRCRCRGSARRARPGCRCRPGGPRHEVVHRVEVARALAQRAALGGVERAEARGVGDEAVREPVRVLVEDHGGVVRAVVGAVEAASRCHRYICISPGRPSGSVRKFALLRWSASGTPGPVAAPSMAWASTRSPSRKSPSSNEMSASVRRWSANTLTR